MKFTPNYNLKKPDPSDYARPDPFNDNADAIDQALKNIETALGDKLGTSGDGKDVTVTFAQAASRANINTGEKLSVLLGKIKKYFADLGTAAFKAVEFFAEAAHTHGGITNDGKVGDAADRALYTGVGGAVQAGTLPLAAGGTGATTAAAARTSLGAASRTSGTATLAVAGWVGAAAPYTYELALPGITADDVLDIHAVDGMDKAAADLIKEAWGKAIGYVDPDTGAGKVTFYASEKPAVAIPIYWRLIK